VVELKVRTERQSQLVDITRLVSDAVDGQNGAAVLVYVPHTTAGVTINEHADPAVARDFETALERIVPSDWSWQHIEEGEENAPTHIRAAFMGPSVVASAKPRLTFVTCARTVSPGKPRLTKTTNPFSRATPLPP